MSVKILIFIVLLLFPVLLSCNGTASADTDPSGTPVTSLPANLTPIPTGSSQPGLTPGEGTSSISANDILDRVNQSMANAPAFHFKAIMSLKLNESDSNNIITTRSEGIGKFGSNLAQNNLIEIRNNESLSSVMFEMCVVDGQAFSRNPNTGAWDILRQAPYTSSEPIVRLSTGGLVLINPEIKTETIEKRLFYRLTGIPNNGHELEIEKMTLIIDAGSYLADQVEIVKSPSLASIGELRQFVSSDVKKLYSREHYQLQVLSTPVQVNSPVSTPYPAPSIESTESISTPYGQMTHYYGQRIPLSIQYPANWIQSTGDSRPPFPSVTMFSPDLYHQLAITEPTFTEMGLSDLSADEYNLTIISANQTRIPDFTLINQGSISLPGTEKARVLLFSGENGQRLFYRLFYIYRDNLVFNLIYSYTPGEEDLKSLIEYSLSTLKLN